MNERTASSEREKIIVAGVSHHSLSFAKLETAAVSSEELPAVLADIRRLAELKEAVVLATCSRLEIVGVADDPSRAGERLRQWFSHWARADIGADVYSRTGSEAVEHLFRVTAGLDSWILGESEILRQVKDAYAFAFERGATGPILNRVFQKSLSAGKMVRSETGLQSGIRSIGGAAALVAKSIFGDDRSCRLVVFGSGQATEAVLRHLTAKNFKNILVTNRTFEKAERLADQLGAVACPWGQGVEALSHAEGAIFSTSAMNYLLNEQVLRSLRRRAEKPIFIVDLGLPRNVDPACEKLDGVFLYDLEDLKRAVQDSMARKSLDVEKAEGLAASSALKCWGELERAAASRLDLQALPVGA